MYIQPLPPCEIVEVLDEWSNRKAYGIDKRPGLKQVLALSSLTTGSWYLGRYTLVHTAGKYSETYIQHSVTNASTGKATSLIDDYRRTRLTAQDLTGKGNVGWTPGQIARSVNAWLNISQKPVENPKAILAEYNYYHCMPSSMQDGCMWDMSGAYWQVASRLPSPRVYFTTTPQSPLLFGSLTATQRQRWESMLTRLQPHKHVRLAIIGLHTAGWDDDPFATTSSWCIRKGRVVKQPAHIGTLNPMGILVVRSVYELCQQQRIEADGCYAYVDCVVADSDRSMSYWHDYDIAFKAKARGIVAIENLESRKVGELETPSYRVRQRQYRHMAERGYAGPLTSTVQRSYIGRMIDPQLYYHPLFL